METDQSSILIVGYGEMGHAFEYLLAGRGRLQVWRRGGGPGIPVLEDAAKQSEFVIFCVPAQPIAELADRIAAILPEHSITLCISKGLDEDGRTTARIFEQVYGKRRQYALLYGPMISEEIRSGRPAFAQLGTASDEVWWRVRGLLGNTPIYLEQNRDVRGIALSAVLKNVYAILFGVADETGLGDNTRGYLAVSCLHEMAAIVSSLGGEASTCYGLAGLGDLVTTGTSAGSHHRDLGRILARGGTGLIRGEGIHTLAMVRRHAIFDIQNYPLFRLVDRLVRDPSRASEIFTAYLVGLAG